MLPTSETNPHTANRQRLISPDLARGITLLGIALANGVTAWVDTSSAELATNYGGVYDDSLLDKIAVVLGTVFIHVRGLPMFATLLGLGVGMIAMSLWRRGYPPGSARGVLARRYGVLAAFGLVHLVFLFYGDIMFFYGLAGMVMALLLTLRDKVLLWIAGVVLALQAVGFTAVGVFLAMNPESAGLTSGGAGFGNPQTYGENLVTGLITLAGGLLGFPVQAALYLPLIMLGFVAARRGVLGDTRAHRRLLLTWMCVGAAVMVLIGLPWGLSEVGVLPVALVPFFQLANMGFGPLTGPGIIAAVALLVQPLQDRINRDREAGRAPGLPVTVWALAALGKRSMTGYVLQSVFFIILLRPFGLGLGAEQGAFEVSLIAFGVWVATLVIAVVLEYAGKPGPLEYAHRYLAYGRGGLQQRWLPRELRERHTADEPSAGSLPRQEPTGAGEESPGTQTRAPSPGDGASRRREELLDGRGVDSATDDRFNPYRGTAEPGHESGTEGVPPEHR